METAAVVFPGVSLGDGAVLDHFVVLGRPARGLKPGQSLLAIGSGAVVRSHSVFYAGSRIGENFQCGHNVLIREGCIIDDNCSVGSGSVLEFNVKLGKGVRIHSHCFIPEYSVLEDGCWLGPNVVLTNAPFPASPRAKETLEGVVVGRGARVGANVTVLPGVRIGEGALVGAGSVVTKDVPARSVVAGNPAQVIKMVKDLKYRDTGLSVYGEDENE